ncbi:PLP-dependent cysteine synthase family protein [Streptomyces antnestii]|uniref:L-cysteine desulfhydrase Cds1 n=1 Tax=Streptomyces antnestii TaxID=2494256 RepID=A0A437NYQ1_9ACTN|nr:PLP-dependent cysteine synthase family protein [Streptomyces sp. San01]RVU15117.1 PLP-dependent cysteine synthase family protein [Streptomyces sp. San01]
MTDTIAQSAGGTLGDAHILDVDRYDADYRRWLTDAIGKVQAEGTRSADTHLLAVPYLSQRGVDIYLKDESTHHTGSLKHRLARSLFLYALVNGWIRPGLPIIEASSGSTAVSEAFFASLIGNPFIAVMARTTSASKVALIESHGGTCHFVDQPSEVYTVAAGLAAETGGHYMDQFTYAERATDWRGNNNIAESIFSQMRNERFPEPAWVVATAGTGGTSATLARYIRYTGRRTGLCVADPENSAFFDGWRHQDPTVATDTGSRIEGIGRQRLEPSFIHSAVDRMMRVPDAASIAAIRFYEGRTGRKVGASTGTGMWAAFRLAHQMIHERRTGSIVTLLCDSGDRYLDKYYDDGWLAAEHIDIEPYRAELTAFLGDSAR